MNTSHPRFPSKTTFLSIETFHQNLNHYEKPDFDHPFGCCSGGDLGAEARQKNREIGKTARGDFRGNPGRPFLDS